MQTTVQAEGHAPLPTSSYLLAHPTAFMGFGTFADTPAAVSVLVSGGGSETWGGLAPVQGRGQEAHGWAVGDRESRTGWSLVAPVRVGS
jgi:hypothetical protein